MLPTALEFDGDVKGNFSDNYKSFATITKEVIVPSLKCPMPLNELKASS
jgi:hypothetical protein